MNSECIICVLTSHGTGLALIFEELSSRYALETRETDMIAANLEPLRVQALESLKVAKLSHGSRANNFENAAIRLAWRSFNP